MSLWSFFTILSANLVLQLAIIEHKGTDFKDNIAHEPTVKILLY